MKKVECEFFPCISNGTSNGNFYTRCTVSSNKNSSSENLLDPFLVTYSKEKWFGFVFFWCIIVIPCIFHLAFISMRTKWPARKSIFFLHFFFAKVHTFFIGIHINCNVVSVTKIWHFHWCLRLIQCTSSHSAFTTDKLAALLVVHRSVCWYAVLFIETNRIFHC